MRLSKEEWADWRDHPVTIEFFKTVHQHREEALQKLAYGLYSEEPGKQSILVGSINAFSKILEVEFAEDTTHG